MKVLLNLESIHIFDFLIFSPSIKFKLFSTKYFYQFACFKFDHD